jgi:hypothetical protein
MLCCVADTNTKVKVWWAIAAYTTVHAVCFIADPPTQVQMLCCVADTTTKVQVVLCC